MKPFISIVIPAYNKEAFIGRTIESVLSQVYRNWELIVVDDGSDDGTQDVVRSFVDPRIRLVTQENSGVSAARNRGVSEAIADWVAFLDADDEWLPEFLQEVCRFLNEEPNVVAVFTNGYISDGSRKWVAIPLDRSAPTVITDYCRFFLSNRAGIHSSRVVAHRNALQIIGGFPEGRTNWEDLDTWARLSWTGNIGYIPRPLAVKNLHVPNSASKVGAKRPTGYARIWETYVEWHKASRIPGALNESALQYAGYFLYWYLIAWIRAGDANQARTVYRMWHKVPLTRTSKMIINILLACPGGLSSWILNLYDFLRVKVRNLKRSLIIARN